MGFVAMGFAALSQQSTSEVILEENEQKLNEPLSANMAALSFCRCLIQLPASGTWVSIDDIYSALLTL